MSSKNYYSILNVSSTATKEEIKQAFNMLSKRYHPDRMNGEDTVYKDIAEAYSVLKNKERRREYDESLVTVDSCKNSFMEFQEHNVPEELTEQEYSRRKQLLKAVPVVESTYSLSYFMRLVAQASLNPDIAIHDFLFAIADKLELIDNSSNNVIFETEKLFNDITEELIPRKKIDMEQLLLNREQTLFEVDYEDKDWDMDGTKIESDESIRSKFDSMMSQRDTDMNSIQMLQQKIKESNNEWDESNIYSGLTNDGIFEETSLYSGFNESELFNQK